MHVFGDLATIRLDESHAIDRLKKACPTSTSIGWRPGQYAVRLPVLRVVLDLGPTRGGQFLRARTMKVGISLENAFWPAITSNCPGLPNDPVHASEIDSNKRDRIWRPMPNALGEDFPTAGSSRRSACCRRGSESGLRPRQLHPNPEGTSAGHPRAQ